MTIDLKEGERLDDLQREGLRIIQHPKRFCFGMDAVLLSEFAKAHSGETVMDLCTGTGVLPLLMSARYAGTSYMGLEIQEASADMAARSVELNGLQDRIRIIQGDLCRIEDVPEIAEKRGRFHAVTVNPPYMRLPDGAANHLGAMSAARHELYCTLSDVVETAAKLLRNKGRFYIVYRPLRLVDLLSQMRRCGLEPKRLQLVLPHEGEEPNLVLAEGVKGAGPELRALPPLVVYNADGTYTPELQKIYYGE